MDENADVVDAGADVEELKRDVVALGVAGVVTPGVGAAGVLKTVFLPHVT